MHPKFLVKVQSREAVIGIIGLGYVGLPLLLLFTERGFRTIGFDIDPAKTAALKKGQSYINHLSPDRVERALATGRMDVTTAYARTAECDAVLIAVPTPLTRNREPDMTFIVSTCEALLGGLHAGQLIVLESTTYPGTTDEVVVPILERSGLRANVDFHVAFSPEREDPSRTDYTTETIPKVVGSASAEGLAMAEALYGAVVTRTVPVSSARVAEAAKLMENIFRAVNIALVNELKVTFMRMGIDVWEVIDAARTKPFGYMPFYPGPGLGGHCIPIDPFYLTWKAREYGAVTKFIELAGEINTSMPDFVVRRVMEVLNDQGKALRGSRVLLLGIAYKANVDDDRESPSYHLLEKLEAAGALVSYHDPFIPVIRPSREFARFAGRRSVPIDNTYDLILLATPHDAFRRIDFSGVSVPIVDTRNIVPRGHPFLHQA